MERLHIVDGYGYIFRAHYGLAGAAGGRGVRLSRADGMPTGALYVYAQMLVRLHLDVKPQRVVVVFDAPGKTFRNELDDEYKATRRETPEDLQAQLPHFRPMTEAFAWPVVAVPGVEADDTIATLVHRARDRGWDVTVFSADKDLMQLVDPHVEVIDSMRQKVYDRSAVEAKFGVGPEHVADWLALVGDASDNIPGMKGVGKKTAARLLLEHGSIDGILAHTGDLKGKMKERFENPEELERLALSRRLVELKTDVELGVELDALVPGPWEGDRLKQIFIDMEFHALLDRLDVGVGGDLDQPTEAVELGPEPVVASSWDDVLPLVTAAREKGHLALSVAAETDRPDRCHAVGLALAVEDRAPVYLPLCHRYLSAPLQLAADSAPGELLELLADADFAIWTHDAKESRRVLRRLGWSLEGVAMDTTLAGYLADASTESHDVVSAAKSLLQVELPTRKALLGTGKKARAVESMAVEEVARFAGSRAAAVLALVPRLQKRLDDAGGAELFRGLELPLARLLADLEDRGITVDVAYLRELADRVSGQIAELEKRAHDAVEESFNLGSPKQLSQILFDKLELRGEVMKKTKSGGYSTDAEVLESMRSEHEVVPLILEHRELTKLKGTYIDALPPLVNPRTGRVHTSFRQAVAATGRLSSQDPNLQNIPVRTELGRQIRRAFVSARGSKLVSADYSQIELRVMAHLSGDPVLVRAFKDDIDIHTQTAAEVFDIALDAVGADERRVAKAVNYGLIYGQSAFGLGRALDISRGEAQTYIDRYFERFSRVRVFMDEVVNQARLRGYAETVLGRRRPIPDLRSQSYRLRSAAERVAQNTPMQGSAADIIKLAMLKVDPLLDEHGAAMLLTVHDELVIEAPEDRAEEVGAAVRQAMEAAYDLEVPLRVDVGIAESWADAH